MWQRSEDYLSRQGLRGNDLTIWTSACTCELAESGFMGKWELECIVNNNYKDYFEDKG